MCAMTLTYRLSTGDTETIVSTEFVTETIVSVSPASLSFGGGHSSLLPGHM